MAKIVLGIGTSHGPQLGIPAEKLAFGTSEIRNWILAAGALEHLDMKLVDYVPCYRSIAGTGCAMGFAHWN